MDFHLLKNGEIFGAITVFRLKYRGTLFFCPPKNAQKSPLRKEGENVSGPCLPIKFSRVGLAPPLAVIPSAVLRSFSEAGRSRGIY
jgi:hypothetical protein